MFARRYHHKMDRIVLERWSKLREFPIDWKKDIPEFGMVIWDFEIPLAIGFLRSMEEDFAFLDSYMTNPEAPALLRDAALDLLTLTLISEAKDLGWKHLFAYTRELNIMNRLVKFGFKKMPHTMMSMTLGEK